MVYADTVAGLSGLGDLMLTCAAPASRNYSLGFALGRGERLEDVLGSRSAVTEGVATAPALVARAATAGADLPVCAAVAGVVGGQLELAAGDGAPALPPAQTGVNGGRQNQIMESSRPGAARLAKGAPRFAGNPSA